MATPVKPPEKGKVVVTQDPLNVFRFENEWNASFFTCCEDIKLTLCTYICWLCIFCSLEREMKEHPCAWFCIPFPMIVFRMKMRSNLRIRGSMWRDSLTTLFLPWCTLIQMKAELKNRGLSHWP